MSVTIDQSHASCVVFTYKEGLLSAVAHDLRIRVGRWSLTWQGDQATPGALEARFDATSLVVDSVMRDGQPAPGVLDAKDRGKIERSIREDVLAAQRFPDIRFRADAAAPRAGALAGELTLHGVTKRVSVEVREEGGELVAELRIHQPDYGVKPYSAMLGTLKIKPEVKVRVAIPATLVKGA